METLMTVIGTIFTAAVILGTLAHVFKVEMKKYKEGEEMILRVAFVYTPIFVLAMYIIK